MIYHLNQKFQTNILIMFYYTNDCNDHNLFRKEDVNAVATI